MSDRITIGLTSAVPADVKAAWGARAILGSDSGFVDIVHDRTSHVGSQAAKRKLIDGLRAADKVMRRKVEGLVICGLMEPHRSEKFVLYEDDSICIAGNTNGSCGYLYIAAWLKGAS